MLKTLIVGIGSYYGQDIIGLQLTEQLQKKYRNKPDIRVYKTNAPQEILVLMDKLKNPSLERLFIIDALESEKSVCEITQFNLPELQSSTHPLSDHYASLYEVLKLIQILYLPQLEIIILGVSSNQSDRQLIKSLSRLHSLISAV